MTTSPEQLKRILEAAIMVAGHALTIADMQKLFDEDNQPDAKAIQAVLQAIQADYTDKGVELREVASGFQFQARAELSQWISRLWEERTPRYSRAVLETIVLIAYRQPITRAEIEEIRGVAVSSHIVKTLLEREWIRVIGHRDVPGKPALYGTTKAFLDHLNLKNLAELPALSELHDLESQEEKLQVQLELAEIPMDREHAMSEEEEILSMEAQLEGEEVLLTPDQTRDILENQIEVETAEDIIKTEILLAEAEDLLNTEITAIEQIEDSDNESEKETTGAIEVEMESEQQTATPISSHESEEEYLNAKATPEFSE